MMLLSDSRLYTGDRRTPYGRRRIVVKNQQVALVHDRVSKVDVPIMWLHPSADTYLG